MKRFECSALLFDLDGVLVDSAGHVEQEWRRWAAARGLPAKPFLRVCHGRRALETIRLVAPHLDAEAEVQAFLPMEHAEPIRPFPGATRLLGALPPLSWAVVTSGPRAAAIGRLVRAGLPVPSVLVAAEDVELGKPSPQGYLAAARALGILPAACLVVEDAPAGIEAARAAGTMVVALTTTHTPGQLAEVEPADGYAASLAGVHLGRLDRGALGGPRLEIFIVER